MSVLIRQVAKSPFTAQLSVDLGPWIHSSLDVYLGGGPFVCEAPDGSCLPSANALKQHGKLYSSQWRSCRHGVDVPCLAFRLLVRDPFHGRDG